MSGRESQQKHGQTAAVGGFMTKNSLAQSKNDIYDYLNLKLTEMHNTYS